MWHTIEPDEKDAAAKLGVAGRNDDTIIQVSDFSAAYDDAIVLHDITFDVRRGEILFIAGDSGSGKTTLLQHMIGLESPVKGRILIDGDDLSNTPPGPLRDKIMRKFGVSFQSGALFGSMNVLQNVTLQLEQFAHLHGPMADMIALTKLQLVGLADSAQKMPTELSGGMQKRVGIARAMALDPIIIFMDEPSAGLDPITSAEMDQLILTLNKLLKTTFVIVSHELTSIFKIAHRVLLLSMEKQTLVAEGDPNELRTHSSDPWVRAFFSGEIPPSDSRASVPKTANAKPSP
jgi:phospholipid/cholesterol/gamma-HCH transport system ATP-binding protein